MFRLRLNLALIFVVGTLGCARNPVTGKRQIVLVSEGQEIALGAQSHGTLEIRGVEGRGTAVILRVPHPAKHESAATA